MHDRWESEPACELRVLVGGLVFLGVERAGPEDDVVCDDNEVALWRVLRRPGVDEPTKHADRVCPSLAVDLMKDDSSKIKCRSGEVMRASCARNRW
jgi:hypothetical protein